MKVGIVGGTGNISTSVVRLLQERGHDVTCITRGASGALPDGIRHLSGDRHDLDWFVPAVQRERFDAAVAHLRARGAEAVVLGCTELSILRTDLAVDGLRVAWPSGAISERPAVRREVVALYDLACEKLGVQPRPHA